MPAAGGGTTITALGAGLFSILLGPLLSAGANWLYVALGSTQTCRIDIEITTDGGTTWAVYKTIADAAGNDATYIRTVEVSQYVPYNFRVRVKNTSASNANIVYDARLFNVIQH